MRKVVIVTEGGQEFGFGHLTRCSAFYDFFYGKNFEVEFIIQGDLKAKKYLKNKKVTLLDWHNNINKNLIPVLDTDILILDSYCISQEDAKLLSNLSVNLVVIEDFIRRDYTNAIIIDWSLNADKLDYYKIKNPTNTYLLGIDYLVIRKAFIDLYNTPKKSNSIEVLISLGGSDIRNLTGSIVNKISNKFPNINFHAVIGSDNDKTIIKNKFNNIYKYNNLNEKEMASLMQKCHVAVSGGGQTLYELAVLNVDIMAIELIENQKEELKVWEDNKLLLFNLKWNDENLIEHIFNTIKRFDLNKKNKLFLFNSNGLNKIYQNIITKQA